MPMSHHVFQQLDYNTIITAASKLCRHKNLQRRIPVMSGEEPPKHPIGQGARERRPSTITNV